MSGTQERLSDVPSSTDRRERPLPTGFVNMLEARQRAVDSLLCVGLDPVLENMPLGFKQAVTEAAFLTGNEAEQELDAFVVGRFSQGIVDATHPFVSAYKPNIAFYERYGEGGIAALRATVSHIRKVDPTIPIILDAKRADIGATNQGYADMVKGLGVDAVTVNPYFGIEGKGALDPFLNLGDTGIIILCRTSNPEAAQMQDVIVKDHELGQVPYYMMVARLAEKARQTNPNVAIVVGATAPEQLRQVREIFKGQILVPGLGKQGGRPEDLVGAFDDKGLGIIANNASAIIHASRGSDCFVAASLAAKDWRDRINEARKLPKPAEQSQEEKLAARQERVRELLSNTGAVITDSHIVYTSGRHGRDYVNKDAVYPHTGETAELCAMFAQDFAGSNVETVAGPAVGGVILAHETASQLTQLTGRDTLGVHADKDADGNFTFGRGYADQIRGRRVLVVEDVLTTGGSAKKVIDAVRDAGGEVVGLGVLCNRGDVKPQELGVDAIDALLNVQMESWAEEDCGFCKDGVAVNTTVGKGKAFLERQRTATSTN